MRLKRWHRLGVVLSIFWVLYSAGATRNQQLQFVETSASINMQTCTDEGKPIETCLKVSSDKYKELLPVNWEQIAADAFVPLILVWMTVFIFIGCYKWIMGKPENN